MTNKTLQKILLGLTLAVVPISCEKTIYVPEINFDYNNVEFDIPEMNFRNQTEMFSWVAKNIKYTSDLELYGKQEYWANPKEIFDNKAGDCEDFVILGLYFLRKYFNVDGKLVIGIRKDNPNSGHAWIEIGEDYIEADTGNLMDKDEVDFYYSIHSKLDYAEVMELISKPIRKSLSGIIVNSQGEKRLEVNLR